MSLAETVLLGAIAGFTIYLGLPVGRVGRVDDRLRVALAMFSVGILPALRTGMTIAVAIGLHNFAEGLAIS